MIEMIIQCFNANSGNQCAIINELPMVKIAAPMDPSHVLPGEIRSYNLVLPIKLPTK